MLAFEEVGFIPGHPQLAAREPEEEREPDHPERHRGDLAPSSGPGALA